MCEDMISSHVKISMMSLISSLPLKIVLVFDGVSSKHLQDFLESLRQSSAIFGDLRKFSENIRELRRAFGTILKNLRKSSGSCRKSSGNYQKRRQPYVYIKKNITR